MRDASVPTRPRSSSGTRLTPPTQPSVIAGVRCRPIPTFPALVLLLVLSLPTVSFRASAETIVRESVSASVLTNYGLPDHLLQRFNDRRLIDSFQNRQYRAAPSIGPMPSKEFTARGRVGKFVRVLKAEREASIEQLRATCPSNAVPPRGFRAPILDHRQTAGSNLWWVLPPPTGADAEAAAWIERRLASDGLLPTLAHVLQILGPGTPDLARLQVLGLPTDLLRHFRYPPEGAAAPKGTELEIVRTISRRLAAGTPLNDLIASLKSAEFDFQPSAPDFIVASECGRHEVGLLRLQAGGGWSDGLIPGDVLDVLYQLVEAFPNADFIISVPQIAADGVEWMAKTLWRLRRVHQVTLCVEPYRMSSWAQDNGKGGLLARPPNPTNAVPATLVPRYACIDEGASQFMPAESFLMDGLAAAGHPVLHSSLLFQGGNVMPVADPSSPRPVLLVGEGEIYRNVALGLTREQAIEAFRREFGASRCEVLPSVSYHLDYDVNLRTDGEKPLAFVNDHPAAVRIILGLGLAALAKAPGIDTNALRNAEQRLAVNDAPGLSQALTQLLSRLPRGPDGIAEAVSRCFVIDTTDSAARNLQTFLVAADLLEVSLPSTTTSAPDSPRGLYLQALRRIEEARASQAGRLRELGFQLIPIPSLTELHYAINYLNGIQHAGGYVMPVFGGFYTPLDRAAADAFRKALGPQRKIQPIRSAESQRKFGAVHCTSSVYPRP
ncbi:MAG: agmatine deiminase family protein [Verrucomicrobiales bacterium]|nr:agmatine deiminase family protein [Verrucomicrobiales bacterium]